MWYRTQGSGYLQAEASIRVAGMIPSVDPAKSLTPLMCLWTSISVSLASLDFMLLLVLQTSDGIVYLKGKNQWISINKLLPIFRKGEKDHYHLKTNRTQKITNKTFPLQPIAPCGWAWWRCVDGNGHDLVKFGASGMCSIPVCMCWKNWKWPSSLKAMVATSSWRRLWLSTF